jgi:hypothetical protein
MDNLYVIVWESWVTLATSVAMSSATASPDSEDRGNMGRINIHRDAQTYTHT